MCKPESTPMIIQSTEPMNQDLDGTFVLESNSTELPNITNFKISKWFLIIGFFEICDWKLCVPWSCQHGEPQFSHAPSQSLRSREYPLNPLRAKEYRLWITYTWPCVSRSRLQLLSSHPRLDLDWLNPKQKRG